MQLTFPFSKLQNGAEVRSFYRINCKERDEKNRKYLIDWGQVFNLFGMRKNNKIRINFRIALEFGDWQTGYISFLLKRRIYRNVRFGLLLLGSSVYILGLESYFYTFVFLKKNILYPIIYTLTVPNFFKQSSNF